MIHLFDSEASFCGVAMLSLSINIYTMFLGGNCERRGVFNGGKMVIRARMPILPITCPAGDLFR